MTDGVMGKDTTAPKLTNDVRSRNKHLAQKRYIVEQDFGLSHLHDGAYRARFTTIGKNMWDTLWRQGAFTLFRGSQIIGAT